LSVGMGYCLWLREPECSATLLTMQARSAPAEVRCRSRRSCGGSGRRDGHQEGQVGGGYLAISLCDELAARSQLLGALSRSGSRCAETVRMIWRPGQIFVAFRGWLGQAGVRRRPAQELWALASTLHYEGQRMGRDIASQGRHLISCNMLERCEQAGNGKSQCFASNPCC
jgi:hypothetical protein